MLIELLEMKASAKGNDSGVPVNGGMLKMPKPLSAKSY